MSRLARALLLVAIARSMPAQPSAQHETINLRDVAPTVGVRIDSLARSAVITVGPLHIPAATPYNHHFAAAPMPFTWPATGWVQGFRIELLDSAGRALPSDMLHHAGVINLDRRQLAYPIAERLFAAGRETEPVALPGSLGVPLSRDQHMLLYYALANPTNRDLNSVTLRVTMPWTSEGRDNLRTVMPMYFDAHPVDGAASTFDVAPGRSTTSSEFTLPVAGHLRYLGGHLHDYGVELRLEDAESNTVLARLGADRAADGIVRGVDRTKFYLKRDGLRLEANHRYRAVAVYDNSTCATVSGAMGLLVAVFTPDAMDHWPAVDTTDARYRKDLAWLLETGGPHETEAHDHGSAVDAPSVGRACESSGLTSPRSSTTIDAPSSIALPTAIGLLGGVVGLAAGVVVGLPVDKSGATSVLAGLFGQTLGVPLGVRLANGGRGTHFGRSYLASTVIGIGGPLLISAIDIKSHSSRSSATLLSFMAVPVLQAFASAAIDRPPGATTQP